MQNNNLPQDFLTEVLKNEGGFINHPLDKGGATNKGITFKNYVSYCSLYLNKKNVTIEDLKNISNIDIYNFYNALYWQPSKAWFLLDCGLNKSSFKLFDLAVNCGTKQATKFLQRSLNIVADGIHGKITDNAIINFKNDDLLLLNLKNYANIFYKAIVKNNPTQSVFLNGWLKRLEKGI